MSDPEGQTEAASQDLKSVSMIGHGDNIPDTPKGGSGLLVQRFRRNFTSERDFDGGFLGVELPLGKRVYKPGMTVGGVTTRRCTVMP